MTSTGAGGPLVKEIAAYERMQEELERDYAGKWVVFHNGRLARTFDGFEESAEWALDEYGEKHFLIRKVGLEVLPPPILGLPYVPHDA